MKPQPIRDEAPREPLKVQVRNSRMRWGGFGSVVNAKVQIRRGTLVRIRGGFFLGRLFFGSCFFLDVFWWGTKEWRGLRL